MAAVIRLRRQGGRKKPFYRVVVADARSPRNGRFVELLGTYDPRANPPKLVVRQQRLDWWLKSGARPSQTVRRALSRQTAAPAST